MEDKNFVAPVAQRVRRAWILAQEKYNKMDEKQKKEIYLHIKMERGQSFD